MATTVIHDCCEAGAIAGLLANRNYGTITAASYASFIAVAKAIADEFITVNAASGAAIADADKVNIGNVVQAAAEGAVFGRVPAGATPTEADIVQIASVIYAVAASAKANGGLS